MMRRKLIISAVTVAIVLVPAAAAWAPKIAGLIGK